MIDVWHSVRCRQVKNEASRSFETRETARLKTIIEKQASELARSRGSNV